jgi:hypothetical protein
MKTCKCIAVLLNMDIPSMELILLLILLLLLVAPMIKVKSAEEYELEKKRGALYRAEQDLASIISSAEDFFDSPSDKEAVLKQIQENPDEVLMFGSPFKKKIAHAMIAIASLTKEVDEIAEAIADKKLTPAQVKVQITKALSDQRTFLETTVKEIMAREKARTDQLLDEQKRQFEQQLYEQQLSKFAPEKTMKERLAEERARTDSVVHELSFQIQRQWCLKFDDLAGKLSHVERKLIASSLWTRSSIVNYCRLFKIDTRRKGKRPTSTISLKKEVVQRFLSIGPDEWVQFENDPRIYEDGPHLDIYIKDD